MTVEYSCKKSYNNGPWFFNYNKLAYAKLHLCYDRFIVLSEMVFWGTSTTQRNDIQHKDSKHSNKNASLNLMLSFVMIIR